VQAARDGPVAQIAIHTGPGGPPSPQDHPHRVVLNLRGQYT